jgi:hypothetical protein
MYRLYLTYILTILTSTSIAQRKLLDYKHVIDVRLLAYFDSALVKQMSCTVSSLVGLDSVESFYTRSYVPTKDNRAAFLSITFTYKFYSKSINHTFDFDVSISKDKIVTTDFSKWEEIPSCIRSNLACDFINKDSAVKIALADSIEYPNNLSVRFGRPLRTNEYFWYINGRPKQTQNKGARRTTTRKVSPKQRKIINALTGDIISWQEYNKL